jgi:UDP-2,3-diacylglucosamine hydrolase
MTIGIIAAAGREPGQVIAACRAKNRDFFVVALEGCADPAVIEGTDHAWVRLGAGGQMLKALHNAGATEIVFCGRIEDFSLKSLRPDLWTIKFIARHGATLLQDESKLIAALVAELERSEGLRVVDAKSLLAA